MSQIGKDIYMHPTTFFEMYNLRLLQIYSSTNVKRYEVFLPYGLRFLPDSLRYLNWSEYPLRSLPSSFTPENLVALEMSHSQLEQLWDGIQNLSNLKHINLSYSKHLTQIPNLSRVTNLESINLLFCTSLFEVASHNNQNLHKLTILRLRYCEKLLTLPGKIHTRSLRLLDLYGCSNLKTLPEIYGNLESLQIGETAIEELPTSILSLNNLSELDLKDCKYLKNLPSGMRELTSLANLNLHGCSSLEKFPELPKCVKNVCLSHTAIEQVPSSIEYLCDVEQLLLRGCTRLASLPASLCRLKSLKHLDLSYCSNLIDFPDIVEPMEHLITLELQGTGIRELPSSIENLVKLQDLFLNGCKNLEFVPNNISKIDGLKLLNLSNCSKLENLPSLLVGLSSLTELHMSCCNVQEIPDWLIGLSSLEYLDLSRTNIDRIPTSIKQLSMLKFLYIQNCKNLQVLPELPMSIAFLDARGCTSLESTSTSMATLTEGCWDDYHVTQNWQLSFYGCTKLDQNERDNMATEFQFRVFYKATAYLQKLGEVEGPYAHRAISICYPGNEIPKWFSNQCEGSSIDVKLSPNWNKDHFMGFALCAVVSFEDNFSNCDYPIFSSEFCFKTHHNESEEFEWSFYDNRCHFREEDRISNTLLRSDHIFMCYELSYHDENYHDYFDATEVSFNFLS